MSGLDGLKVGEELALVAGKNREDVARPMRGYWKVVAIHEGGVSLMDPATQEHLILVRDEYGIPARPLLPAPADVPLLPE